jgi:hypothetical protein
VYSRVCGYCRPVQFWNAGKQAEFDGRKTYSLDKVLGVRVAEDAGGVALADTRAEAAD